MNLQEALLCPSVKYGRKHRCVLPAGHDDDHEDADGRTWHNYGPLQSYEIHWMSGHVETVQAHQVTYPHAGLAMAATVFGTPTEGGAPRVQMHGEINGHWVLVLAAREEDIRTIRNVTGGEPLP